MSVARERGRRGTEPSHQRAIQARVPRLAMAMRMRGRERGMRLTRVGGSGWLASMTFELGSALLEGGFGRLGISNRGGVA